MSGKEPPQAHPPPQMRIISEDYFCIIPRSIPRITILRVIFLVFIIELIQPWICH